jgi:AraC-like DNA-binding protein
MGREKEKQPSDVLKSLVETELLANMLIELKELDIEAIMPTFYKVAKVLTEKNPDKSEEMGLLVPLLIALLVVQPKPASVNEHSFGTETVAKTVDKPVVNTGLAEKGIELMRKHLEGRTTLAEQKEGISLASLARHAESNPTSLTESFHIKTRTSPMKFWRIMRLEHAETLLINTDKSILEIALLSQFGNHSNFATIFRNYYKKTPSEFRRENRKSTV